MQSKPESGDGLAMQLENAYLGLRSTRKTKDRLEVVHPSWVDQDRELLGGGESHRPKESEVETHQEVGAGGGGRGDDEEKRTE